MQYVLVFGARNEEIQVFIPADPALEKMESVEIHFEKSKIVFSFQNVLKVLFFAVILLCWDPKSVV